MENLKFKFFLDGFKKRERSLQDTIMMMSTTSCYNNNTISTHRINDRVKSVMEKLRLIRESEYGTTTRNQIYENEEVVCEDNPMTMQEQIYEEEKV